VHQNEIVRLKAQLLRDRDHHSSSPGAGGHDDMAHEHEHVTPQPHPSGQPAPSDYARNLEVSLQQVAPRSAPQPLNPKP
jgi:hypothetical protein